MPERHRLINLSVPAIEAGYRVGWEVADDWSEADKWEWRPATYPDHH